MGTPRKSLDLIPHLCAPFFSLLPLPLQSTQIMALFKKEAGMVKYTLPWERFLSACMKAKADAWMNLTVAQLIYTDTVISAHHRKKHILGAP